MKVSVGSVLKSLDTKFEAFDFTRQSTPEAGHSYYRWLDKDVRESVGLDIRNVAGVVRLDTPHINLRFDSVEDLIAPFQDHHPDLPVTAEDIAARETIGIFPEPQGVITGLFRKTWNITKQTDLEPMVSDFVDHVMKVAKPFWDKYSDPEATLKLLLEDDEQAIKITGADHFRAEKAVAMTFLRRGIDEARIVATKKLPRIRHLPYREEFSRWTKLFFENRRQ